MIPHKASLLQLHINADDRFQGKPLYEAVVTKARAMGLAGASVFLAEMGYGTNQRIHDVMSEYSFVGQPVVVELIDSPERIDNLLAELRMMVREGLVTIRSVSHIGVPPDISPE
jgi:PII-like signaling protein